MFVCVPPSSLLQLLCLLRALVPKLRSFLTSPWSKPPRIQPLLTLGSHANSLGSVLSQFLGQRTRPARKSKTCAKTSVQAPRVLPAPSSPSRPRPRSYSQSARAHSVCKPLRSYLSPLFAATIPTLAQGCFSTHNPLLSAGSKQR